MLDTMLIFAAFTLATLLRHTRYADVCCCCCLLSQARCHADIDIFFFVDAAMLMLRFFLRLHIDAAALRLFFIISPF